MFLNRLTEQEKEDFYYLAVKAAEVNGVVEDEEKELISEYCREMMIDIPEKPDGISIEELKKRFSLASDSHKRITVFELLGLMYVDGVFDEEEKSFVNAFVKGINMSEDVFASVIHCVDRYVETVTEISETILLNQ